MACSPPFVLRCSNVALTFYVALRVFLMGHGGRETGLAMRVSWSSGPHIHTSIDLAEGSKFSTRITLYMAWYMCSLLTKICPYFRLIEAAPDHHHSSTKFTVGTRHCGFCGTVISPSLCLTIRRPGGEKCWKLELSDKMTLLQSSTIQALCSQAYLSLSRLCFSLKKDFFSLAWL